MIPILAKKYDVLIGPWLGLWIALCLATPWTQYESHAEPQMESHTQSPAPIRIVFLGDSLTEGYGISKEDAFPNQVEKNLKAAGYSNIEVIQAGISGSTSASAESRLRWHLKRRPQILILALGANDGLRGLPVSETQKNLSKTIQLAQKEKIQILLVGMKMPPNYGKEYTTEFEAMYSRLGREFQVLRVPFLLQGVAGHRELNQEDGIHPNEKGHLKIAEQLTPYLKKILSSQKLLSNP